MTGSRQNAVRCTIVLAIVAVWQWGLNSSLRFWFSSPSAIASKLVEWLSDGTLSKNLSATLVVMALGYAIGCMIGIVLGLLLGFWPRLARILGPYLSALYALPKIALAPLFIILFGIGFISKIVLVAVTVFFLLFTSTSDGVRNLDPDFMRALYVMGASRQEIIRKVMIPGTVPWIFTGMRIAVRYAFTNTLLAELISANAGLGYLIEYYSGNFDASGAYAAIFVLVVLSVGLTELLTRTERMFRRGIDF